MSAASRRLSRITRIRGCQQRAAQSALAQVEIEMVRIAQTIDRIGNFRKDFALTAAATAGHHICSVGEFGLRLNAIEDALCAKRGAAAVKRDGAHARTIAAWQDHRIAETLHQRAVRIETIDEERRASAHMPPRLRAKWGGAA